MKRLILCAATFLAVFGMSLCAYGVVVLPGDYFVTGNRSRAGWGLVHFSANRICFQSLTLAENMDLSPFAAQESVEVIPC